MTTSLPQDRFAHLVKLAARGLARALQMRLTEHAVSYGHWTFLRILWEAEGLTQRELGDRAGRDRAHDVCGATSDGKARLRGAQAQSEEPQGDAGLSDAGGDGR